MKKNVRLYSKHSLDPESNNVMIPLQPRSAPPYQNQRGTAPNELIRQQWMLRPTLSLNQHSSINRRRRSAFFFPLIDQDSNRTDRKNGLLSGTSRLNLPWRQSRNSRASENWQMFYTGNFIQGRFTSSDPPSDDGSTSAATPLITKLDKYTSAELKEYRQIFNMFDAGNLFIKIRFIVTIILF